MQKSNNSAAYTCDNNTKEKVINAKIVLNELQKRR